ncbi:hypothetical protein ACOME3_008374, partial [Neoechinorhynchus agilis]
MSIDNTGHMIRRQDAIEELTELEFIAPNECGYNLTKLGKTATRFPLDPRLSKVLIGSWKLGCTSDALNLISILSVDSIFLIKNHESKEDHARQSFFSEDGDHFTCLRALSAYKKAKEKSVGMCD